MNMKQILQLLLVFLTVSISLPCYAKDEITLTVTSDGATKDEAIKNALRTAIEQTYGVFVSSNTDILNDDLIKDEIATVSSGNIKKFTEMVYSHNENIHKITLEVIVSKGKLLSYAKSKGAEAECEIDGASLASDIELQILYKRNEEAAIKNLIAELLSQLDKCFDYKLFVDKFSYTPQEVRWDHIDCTYDLIEPITQYSEESVSIPYKVTATLNKKGVSIFTQFIDKLKNLGLKDNQGQQDNRTPIFSLPFCTVKENKKYPEYSPLRFSVEPEPHSSIIFRSNKSVESLKLLFAGSIGYTCHGESKSPITQWLYDCSIDMGDGVLNNPNIKNIGRGCILNGNYGSDHRSSPLDAIRLEQDAEYYFSFGKINLPIDEVKKIKNIKVVHN